MKCHQYKEHSLHQLYPSNACLQHATYSRRVLQPVLRLRNYIVASIDAVAATSASHVMSGHNGPFNARLPYPLAASPR